MRAWNPMRRKVSPQRLGELVMLVVCVLIVVSAVLAVPVMIGLVVGLVHRQVDP